LGLPRALGAITALAVGAAVALLLVPEFSSEARRFGARLPTILLGSSESPTRALLVLGVYLVVNQIEGNVILPLVMARTVDLHPALVAIGLLIPAVVGDHHVQQLDRARALDGEFISQPGQQRPRPARSGIGLQPCTASGLERPRGQLQPPVFCLDREADPSVGRSGARVSADRFCDQIEVSEAVNREASGASQCPGQAPQNGCQQPHRGDGHDHVAGHEQRQVRRRFGIRRAIGQRLAHPTTGEYHPHLGPFLRSTDELRPVGQGVDHRKPDARPIFGGRDTPEANALVPDDNLDRVGVNHEADDERAWLSGVGVENHVVARFADRGLEVVQQFRVELEWFADSGQRGAHKRGRVGPADQLETDRR
jgi:hypothetical protein